MALQFGIAAAGQQKKHRRAAWPGGAKPVQAARVSINNGVPDKLDVQPGHARRIPVFLEWKNGEQQIDIPGELIGASGPRGPDLGRHVLNDFRIPIEKRPPARANVLFDGAGEAAVKAREINADDDLRLAFDGELEQAVEDAFETEILGECLGQADDRMLS